MYGFSQSEEHRSYIGGTHSLEVICKHYLSKLNLNANNVTHFAMGKSASYILTGSDDDERKSIDPAHPDEKGLIHFYQ